MSRSSMDGFTPRSRPGPTVLFAVATLWVGLLSLGCGHASDPTGAGPLRGPTVVPMSEGGQAGGRRVAEIARGADVIYLGEQHDNPIHHAHQRQVLEALIAEGARPVLAFEMLDESQQPELERALAEATSADEMERRLGWRARGWPDFAMYWPLFDLAARARLAAVALDLDPAASRRIARQGLAALGSDGAALTSLLPPDPEREAAIARAIRDGHCGLLPESRLAVMVEAWHARNVTMAHRLAAALDLGRPVVAIVGRGHQDAGGLPAQLDRLRPGTRQVVVSMVEVPPGERPGAMARSAGGDVVWLTPPVDRGDPCAGLRRTPG